MEPLTQEQFMELYEKSKLIELKPVISSNIAGIGYDADTKLLKVAFKTKDGSNTYLYENVEPEVYDMIITATDSVGKKLNECVVRHKEKYRYIKL